MTDTDTYQKPSLDHIELLINKFAALHARKEAFAASRDIEIYRSSCKLASDAFIDLWSAIQAYGFYHE